MDDSNERQDAPAGAAQLAAERDRVETSPAMPDDADRVEADGDAEGVAHVKHDRGPRMSH